MKIEVLGPGCIRCQTLASNARTAVEDMGLKCEIIKVTNITEIADRGVLITPALAIDGELKTVGKVASIPEIQALLSEVLQ